MRELSIAIAFVMCSLTMQAQAQRFETLQEAAADPFVVELLGEDQLDFLFEQENLAAKQNGISVETDQTHEIYSSLSEKVVLMAEDFADRRWQKNRRAIEFDAGTFLLCLEKLRLIHKQPEFANLEGTIGLTFDYLKRKLDADHRVFAWDVFSKGIAAQTPGVKQMVESNFFVVPMSMKNDLDQAATTGYQLAYERLYKAHSQGRRPTPQSLSGRKFDRMHTDARQQAAKWYKSSRTNFEKRVNESTIEFRRGWFAKEVVSEIQMQGRVRIIKLNSKAKSNLNSARNGLKYAKRNAESAIESAKNGQRAAADTYMTDARGHALEGLEATSNLSDIVRQMQKARVYMIPYVEQVTEITNIESMTTDQLVESLESLPQQGRFAAMRNVLAVLINSTKVVQGAEEMLAEAEELVARTKPVIAAAEQKVKSAVIMQAKTTAKSAAQTFDVSSRQAFDQSMSELAKTLPPADQVKFYQKWGKLVQQAITADPTLMSDESKYLSFIKEHFEGKTAAQIIEP